MLKADPLDYTGAAAINPAQRLLEPLLLPNEQVLYATTISPAIYWKTFVVFLAVAIAMLYSLTFGFYLLAVCGVVFLLSFLTRRYLLLAATDRGVICQAGLLYSEAVSLHYAGIESVEVIRSLMGQWFGYENVVITGKGRLRFMVPYVQDGLEFRNVVLQKMTEAEKA